MKCESCGSDGAIENGPTARQSTGHRYLCTSCFEELVE